MTKPAVLPPPPLVLATTALTQTPAGPMAVLTLTTGAARIRLTLTEGQAVELSDTLSKQLMDAAARVRRVKLGLVVRSRRAATSSVVA
jgi:hypothetical protein